MSDNWEIVILGGADKNGTTKPTISLSPSTLLNCRKSLTIRWSSKSFQIGRWDCLDIVLILPTSGISTLPHGVTRRPTRQCLGTTGRVGHNRMAHLAEANHPVYPIRTTVTDYTRDDEHATIHRHEHPGYTISVPELAWSSPLETYTKSHEYYEKHELLREDFAKGMREAKICVFDASLERKMIRKVSRILRHV